MNQLTILEHKPKEKEKQDPKLFTTIRVTKSTRDHLDRLGNIHEENYDDIIMRIIQEEDEAVKLVFAIKEVLETLQEVKDDRVRMALARVSLRMRK